MPNDGTGTVNPGGKTMYLILSGKRSSGVPRVQLKVDSIKHASDEMQAWIKKTGLWRGDVNTSHVYVGGMTVAKVAFDGKVYRVDPFTKEVFGTDKPDRVLFDPVAYQEQIKAEQERRAQRDRLIDVAGEARHAFMKYVYTTVYEQLKDNPFLQDMRSDMDDLLTRVTQPRTPGMRGMDGFSLRFKYTFKNGSTTRVDVGMKFVYWEDTRLSTEFSSSLSDFSGNAIDRTADVDHILDVLQNARTGLVVIKDAIESETGRTFLETYKTAKKALDG